MDATSHLMSIIMSLFSVILPTKMWFSPAQPVTVKVDAKQPLSLVLTGFDGKAVTAKGSTDAPAAGATADLRAMYPDQLGAVGTYVLFAVPKGKTAAEFVGTPVVVEVVADEAKAGPMVVKLEPLQYAEMTTDAGKMTMAFYYDVAPNTVDSFLRLAGEGYYDGLTFHRIIPGFVLQGGDPQGTGTGGPGYSVGAEFNDHKHTEGVLSMARSNDPNSAGSQFFICLDYNQTRHLDNKYTAYGKVTDGLDVMKKLAQTPIADPEAGRPATPPVIKTVEVLPVKPGHNPYADMFGMK